MKLSKECLLPLLSLSSTLIPAVDSAFIVRSTEDDNWATGLARYDALRRLMVVTTDFHDGTNDLESDGTMDTDCRVLVADGTGQWTKIPFEHPQLCVGGALIDQRNNGTGFVVGIDADQTTLLNVDGIGTENPTPGVSFPLPQGNIPVAVDFGDKEDDWVYIAMHDINGKVVYKGFGVDRPSNLVGIMDYWDKFSNPISLAQDQPNHVPQIIKMNPKTGETGWLAIYEVTGGAATVSAMTYGDFSLIVAGSTSGSGESYGTDDDGDWDGYIVFVNPVTGKPDLAFIDPDTQVVQERAYVRITSDSTGKNDFVNDMCMTGNDLYVVGTTEGRFSGDQDGGAFIVKIDIIKRTITAQRQLGGRNKTGLKVVCSANNVFVGGHKNFDPTYFDNQQNVYVTSLTNDLTQVNWSVDIDSTPYFGETRLDQLVDMEFNPAGDVNVLFNSLIITTGICDIVFLDLQGDSGANEIQKGAQAGKAGIPDGGLQGAEAIKPDVPVDDSMGNQVDDDQQAQEEKKQRIVLALSITIPVTLAFAVILYTVLHTKRQAKELKVKPREPIVEEGAPQDAPAATADSAGVV